MTSPTAAHGQRSYIGRTDLAGPDEIARDLPSRPIVVSRPGAWAGLTLQMYRHPPGGVPERRPRDHLLVLNMAGRVLIEDTSEGVRRRAWADAGDISLSPAGQPVSRSWKGRPEVLLLQIDAGLIDAVAADLDLDPSRIEVQPRLAYRDPVLHGLGGILLSEVTTPGAAAELMADALARALAIQLVRRYSNLATAPALPPSGGELAPRRLAAVVDYMKTHLDQPIRIATLAEVARLSPSQFNRAFGKAMGAPPHRYLSQLRLDKARDLLERTNLPITEVALSCGFDHSQHFATVFRRTTGFTPSRWRSENSLT